MYSLWLYVNHCAPGENYGPIHKHCEMSYFQAVKAYTGFALDAFFITLLKEGTRFMTHEHLKYCFGRIPDDSEAWQRDKIGLIGAL